MLSKLKMSIGKRFHCVNWNFAETVPFYKISTAGSYVKLRCFTQCLLCEILSKYWGHLSKKNKAKNIFS